MLATEVQNSASNDAGRKLTLVAWWSSVISGIEAFKSATLYIRFAFCRPRIALATTTPDTTAVVTS